MGGLHGALHSHVHRNQLHLSRTNPSGLAAMSQDDEDEVQQQGLASGLMMMPEMDDEMEQQQHGALSNDEAHDQLMELPYGGACRAAANVQRCFLVVLQCPLVAHLSVWAA
jgi:hypothetical protein